MNCPIVTQDQKANDKNREKAISAANYREADEEEYSCGKCGAFIQTPEMMECMGTDDDDYGYCTQNDFVCSEDMTCDRWLSGGPVKGMNPKQKILLKIAKLLEEE
jgi:hypothetical protein